MISSTLIEWSVYMTSLWAVKGTVSFNLDAMNMHTAPNSCNSLFLNVHHTEKSVHVIHCQWENFLFRISVLRKPKIIKQDKNLVNESQCVINLQVSFWKFVRLLPFLSCLTIG